MIFFLIINFKISQHGAASFAMRGFSFSHWGLSGPPGWFRNSGEFAMQMTVVFSISWCLLQATKKYFEGSKRWWFLLALFPGTAALSVIGSSSRGGQLALATILIIFFLTGKHFFRKMLLLVFAVYLGLQLLPAEQLKRFNSAGSDRTSQLRLKHWENALEVIKEHPLGIGYYNWRDYYPISFDVIKVEEIHNTPLQAFVELGYPGGILFLFMVITAFIMNAKTKREMGRIDSSNANIIAAIARGLNLGLLSTFISALFMSVLFYPIFWVAFALTSALRHISRNIVKESAKPFNTGNKGI
jgi:O-antigen ligase